MERDLHPALLVALDTSAAISTKESFDNESDPGFKMTKTDLSTNFVLK